MSSVNPHYTFNYSQPSQYRFSHDSVFLARKVFERYASSGLKVARALDLCAGCGIVGLDFLFHCRAEGVTPPAHFDFLEIQPEYRVHFEENVFRLGTISSEIRWVQSNYEVLSADEEKRDSYDLILCNPPYFHLHQGKASPSELKNRSRFFVDSSFEKLIQGLLRVLSPQGEAYILLRDQREHGRDAFDEAKKLVGGQARTEQLEDIRGTGLLRVQRTSRT